MAETRTETARAPFQPPFTSSGLACRCPASGTPGNWRGTAAGSAPAERAAAVVRMIHGANHSGDSVYAALNYGFKNMGRADAFAGAVEGHPDLDAVFGYEAASGAKKAGLPPLMTAAGRAKAARGRGRRTDGFDGMRTAYTPIPERDRKKRVTIADILAMRPGLIPLDEPTASLGPRNTALLEETLRGCTGKG